LIGIILNDGVRLPDIRIGKLRFAANTPYGRYFGVITAYVSENKASTYVFTSALHVTALKLLATTLVASLRDGE